MLCTTTAGGSHVGPSRDLDQRRARQGQRASVGDAGTLRAVEERRRLSAIRGIPERRASGPAGAPRIGERPGGARRACQAAARPPAAARRLAPRRRRARGLYVQPDAVAVVLRGAGDESFVLRTRARSDAGAAARGVAGGAGELRPGRALLMLQDIDRAAPITST